MKSKTVCRELSITEGTALSVLLITAMVAWFYGAILVLS